LAGLREGGRCDEQREKQCAEDSSGQESLLLTGRRVEIGWRSDKHPLTLK